MRQWAWGVDREGATRTSGQQAFRSLFQGSDDLAVCCLTGQSLSQPPFGAGSHEAFMELLFRC